MIPCRAMLDVSAELLRYLSGLLVGECRRRATPARSRKLNCREQATLALRWFRDRTRVEAFGPDHGMSRATACRYACAWESARASCAEERRATWYPLSINDTSSQ